MLTLIVLFLFLAVGLYDCLTLIKKTGKREKVIYFSIMLISFGILLLYSFNVALPSPAGAVIDLLDALLPFEVR